MGPAVELRGGGGGAAETHLSPTPQCPRTPRGLWSGSNFLGASLSPPWDPLGPCEAGAGPPALPPWTAKTCQRCGAPGVGTGKEEVTARERGSVVPTPAQPACTPRRLFLRERAEALSGRRGPHKAAPAPVCSARRRASSGRAAGLAPWALTSAHPGPYPGRPCCMVMGCQGDIHLFLWVWAAAARSSARTDGGGGGECGAREPGNTQQGLLPPGLAGSFQRHPGGPVSQVPRGGTEGGSRGQILSG